MRGPATSPLYTLRSSVYDSKAHFLAGVANNDSSTQEVFVADLSPQQLQRLARRGARAVLDELEREAAAIRRAFPDLFGRGRGRKASGGAASGGRRRRRGMSPAARKAVSERMKKYWADRRKGKGKK